VTLAVVTPCLVLSVDLLIENCRFTWTDPVGKNLDDFLTLLHVK